MKNHTKLIAADAIKSQEFKNALRVCYLGETGEIPVISVSATGKAQVKAQPLLALNLTEKLRSGIARDILAKKGPFIIYDEQSKELLVDEVTALNARLRKR